MSSKTQIRISLKEFAETSCRLDWLETLHKLYGQAGPDLTSETDERTVARMFFRLTADRGLLDANDVMWIFELLSSEQGIALTANFIAPIAGISAGADELRKMEKSELRDTRNRLESILAAVQSAAPNAERQVAAAAAGLHFTAALFALRCNYGKRLIATHLARAIIETFRYRDPHDFWVTAVNSIRKAREHKFDDDIMAAAALAGV